MVAKNKIKIRLNGRYIKIGEKYSIYQLLIKKKIPKKMVAIELNKKIVNKNNFKKIKLKENDVLEIVHFIGGG